MKAGFLKNGILQGAFPIVTIVFLASYLLYGVYPFQMQFEKGIEVVRSRGFELVGDYSLEEKAAGSVEVVEVDFKAFLRTCEGTKGDAETLTIHSDVDSRVLFLVESGEQGAVMIFFCTFK
jgi:hypothetical protein